jgi:hypothetical protein
MARLESVKLNRRLKMSSYTVTLFDRDRFEPNKKTLREFEVVGRAKVHAIRAAYLAMAETSGAKSFEVEVN